MEAPDGHRFRLNKTSILIGALALALWSLLGSPQLAKADGSFFTVADINATLRGLPQADSNKKPSQFHEQYADDPALFALSSYAQLIEAEVPKVASAENSDNPLRQFKDGAILALSVYAEGIAVAQPESMKASVKLTEADNALDALREYASKVGGDEIRVADADNMFDALREFLQKQNGAAPPGQPMAPATPVARPPVPVPDFAAVNVGSNVCLGCHATQIEAFGYTEMGRLLKQGKLECETCHGPGSAHIHAAGCAACHGDGGITTRAGIPSLVGQDPQYLVTAMKDYINGQRHNALMKALLSGVSETEITNIAIYYARQTPERARTPSVGNPAAGKADISTCAACHGEQGVSVSAAFPSLAGQDATYLADAITDYRNGSRKKEVACAACHGERGISKTPGTPSLVGMDPQYLVAAMKAYASGQRKSAVMHALLSGVGDAEFNDMALYFAQQSPVRASTPSVGEVTAGKAASAACAACHGAAGVSTNPAWPSLAGQDARYLAAATEAYKNGSRSDATMKAIAASLDQQTIDNLAAYYASLRPEQPSSAKNTPRKPAPVLLENRLVSGLDQAAIANIAAYYASQRPAPPDTAKYPPPRYVPALVRAAAPVGELSPGGIISFRPDDPGRTVEQNNAVCLNCHERGERTMWQGSPHEEHGLACTNCHTVMKAVSARFLLKTAFQPDTCFQCHKDIRAKTLMSAHMPIGEGKIVCSDCHNPHGGFTEAMLRTDTINDTCYKCHAEKRGPFLFEHEPVRENCLNCHDPHGSVNEYMLKESRPRLCFECHGFGHGMVQGPGGFGFGASMGQSCQNCHINIHGSNSPAGAVFQR